MYSIYLYHNGTYMNDHMHNYDKLVVHFFTFVFRAMILQ